MVQSDHMSLNGTDEYSVSYHTQVEIKPGSDYVIRFDSTDFIFEEISDSILSNDWPVDMQRAITKTPRWLQLDLIRQFQNIENPQDYIDLLLHANKTMTDEIAFCIAHSPQGIIPSAEIISENVYWLYHIDASIDYADIIDVKTSNGNYYSTISYHISEQGVNKTYILPMETYYWGIVHPGISGESVEFIYTTFWREFLFAHNDRGYPLLQELIQNIQFLWDNTSYSQPNQRVWTEWITKHPTAIEAVSYWIGKTVPNKAIGDRPIQPNHIAHQHNGYCGELQTLAVAAQRSVLIPTREANNIGEDHVWREFYHQGWHQGDNWWTDSGGCIDTPYVYTDGWGKDMSAIFAEYGDGRIEDVTSRYLHPEETIIVNFSVYDAFLKPYDNARITVLVQGLKDITWHQYQILLLLENLWKPYEEKFNGTIIESIYQRIRAWINDLPEVIDTSLITTWNYTDVHGKCQFILGKNDQYSFLIQSPSTSLPWPLAKQTAIRRLSTHESKNYHILLPDISRKPLIHRSRISQGPYEATITYQARWEAFHHHIKNGNIGIRKTIDDLPLFIMDTQNYQRYQQGKSFETIAPETQEKDVLSFDFDQDLYMVIPNPSLHTNVVVDLGLNITGAFEGGHVGIDRPRSTLFSHPVFSIGDLIELSGNVNQPSKLYIDQNVHDISKGEWNVLWNTSGLNEGVYPIKIQSGSLSDQRFIELIDATPPTCIIHEPEEHQSYHPSDNLICMGSIQDHSPIASITFSIDGIEQKTEYIDSLDWNVSLDLDDVPIGTHKLTISISDIYGNSQEKSILFHIADPGSTELPRIINHTYELTSQGDWTQVIIYAESITSSLLPIDTLTVFYQKNDRVFEKPMFLYASQPILNRHIEDPYVEQSNEPIYGCFLGDFIRGEILTYWIEARDVLGHTNMTSPITLIC